MVTSDLNFDVRFWEHNGTAKRLVVGHLQRKDPKQTATQHFIFVREHF